jgi:hypothetical protein
MGNNVHNGNFWINFHPKFRYHLFTVKDKIAGANLTTVSYSACVVKIYSATSSLARFEFKTISCSLKNALDYYNIGVVIVNSEVVEMAPGF